MFVHDFVSCARGFEELVAPFADALRDDFGLLAGKAWDADRPIWVDAGLAPDDLSPLCPLPIELGLWRCRAGSVVVPIYWSVSGARLVPSMDFDLELAAHGADSSDIQVMGRYRYLAQPPRSAAESSLAHRATVTAVRRILEALAHGLEQAVPSRAAIGTAGEGSTSTS